MQENFNTELIANSDGLLPNQSPDNMRLMFFAGTHSSTAFRSIHYGAESIFEGLAGSDGKFDTKKNVNKHQQELLESLAEMNLEVIGKPEFAAYNAPFALPFMRRNEVMVEVAL